MSRISKLSSTILSILLIASVSRHGWAAASDEPSEMMARAETLYYEADFAKSVELLLRADDLLQKQPGHLEEKIDVKMQLALGFLGLNDNSRAKDYLVGMYALDADHRIDPQMFAPKVVQLAEEAKAEQKERQCQSLITEAQKQLGAGNSDAVVKTIGSNKTTCPGLTTLSSKTADLVFKEGLDIYKKNQLTDALQKFRAALLLEPTHDLAGQYVELTERKMEVTADRALIAWRKDFEDGNLTLAARDYRELASVSNSKDVEDILVTYRQVLSKQADSWSRACAAHDVAAMQSLRVQVDALLPEPSFGNDLVAKMTCAPPPVGCIQMDSTLVLTRLKTRVDPQFTSQLLSRIREFPVTVRIKARIDEKGNIKTGDMRDGDPILYNGIRSAVDQWKFLPAITEDGSRCVETDIPIVIRYAN